MQAMCVKKSEVQDCHRMSKLYAGVLGIGDIIGMSTGLPQSGN